MEDPVAQERKRSALLIRGFRTVPIPVIVVGFFCALEALFLFLLPAFGLGDGAVLPLAFERLWFQRHGLLSLQETLMGGNVLLAVVLWGCYRTGGSQNTRARFVRSVAYVGAGVLLAAVQWACRALSMAAPKLLLTQVYP